MLLFIKIYITAMILCFSLGFIGILVSDISFSTRTGDYACKALVIGMFMLSIFMIALVIYTVWFM